MGHIYLQRRIGLAKNIITALANFAKVCYHITNCYNAMMERVGVFAHRREKPLRLKGLCD